MIRSPISSEERLRNRVETLENTVKVLVEALAGHLLKVTKLLVDHADGLDEHDQRLDFLDAEVGELLEDAGINLTRRKSLA